MDILSWWWDGHLFFCSYELHLRFWFLGWMDCILFLDHSWRSDPSLNLKIASLWTGELFWDPTIYHQAFELIDLENQLGSSESYPTTDVFRGDCKNQHVDFIALRWSGTWRCVWIYREKKNSSAFGPCFFHVFFFRLEIIYKSVRYTHHTVAGSISISLTKTRIRINSTSAFLRPYLNSQNYGELFSSQIIWFVDDTNVYLGCFFWNKNTQVSLGWHFFFILGVGWEKLQSVKRLYQKKQSVKGQL